MFRFPITNSKLKNKKIHFELLTRCLKTFIFQLRVTNAKLKNIKLHLKLLTERKTEKKKILYTLYFILYTIATLWKYKQKDASKIALLRICDLLKTHPDFKPMDLYLRGLKSGINLALEPEWTYIWVSLYSSFKLT